MKAEELKGKTVDELKKLLMELKKKQFNLRFQKSQGQLDNTAQLRTVRRDVARIKTFLGLQNKTADESGSSKAKAKASTAKSTKKKTTKKAA